MEEDEDETATAVQNVEDSDEKIEELIQDEENQENLGRGKRKRGRPISSKPMKQRMTFSNASVIQNIQDDESEQKDSTVHKCGLCGITYKRRANWQNHLKTHAKEKIYMCGYCGNLFQKANFLQHLKTHDNEQDEEKLRPGVETNIRQPARQTPSQTPASQQLAQSQPSQLPESEMPKAVEEIAAELQPSIPEQSQPPQQTIEETETADGEKQFTVKTQQVTLANQQVATLIDLGNLGDVSIDADGNINYVDKTKDLNQTSMQSEETLVINDDPDYNPNDEADETKYIYKCNVCGKEYNSKSNCHRHLKTHTHAKVYKCNDCDKTYMHRYELKMHRRVHTGKCYT